MHLQHHFELRHTFKRLFVQLESWQGPPHVNKVQQFKIVASFQGLFVYSVVQIKGIKN